MRKRKSVQLTKLLDSSVEFQWSPLLTLSSIHILKDLFLKPFLKLSSVTM